MRDVIYKIHFNNTFFTNDGVPVQIADDENLAFFAENVSLYTSIGGTTPFDIQIIKWDSCKIFLTNYRLIVQNLKNDEESFHVKLDKIAKIDQKGSFDVCFSQEKKNSYFTVFINILVDQRKIFYEELENQRAIFLNNGILEKSKEKKVIPLYCDLEKSNYF